MFYINVYNVYSCYINCYIYIYIIYILFILNILRSFSLIFICPQTKLFIENGDVKGLADRDFQNG